MVTSHEFKGAKQIVVENKGSFCGQSLFLPIVLSGHIVLFRIDTVSISLSFLWVKDFKREAPFLLHSSTPMHSTAEVSRR